VVKNYLISMRSDSVLVIVLPYKSGGQGIESCNNGFFSSLDFLKFPKGVGLNALGNFQREKG
jgi:hypothetical protein